MLKKPRRYTVKILGYLKKSSILSRDGISLFGATYGTAPKYAG